MLGSKMITPANRISFVKHKSLRIRIILLLSASLLTLALVFVLFLLPFINTSTPRTEDLSLKEVSEDEIKLAWTNKDYRVVHDRCVELLDTKPTEPWVRMYHGISSFYIALSLTDLDERNQYLQEAVQSLRISKILLSHRSNGDIEYVLGKAYYQLGYYYEDSAYKYLKESVKEGYSAYDLFEYLGLLSSSFSKYDDALDYFNQSLKLKDREIVYLAIANIYDLKGDHDTAMKEVSQLIAKTKDQLVLEKAYLKQGDLLFKEGKLSEATIAYEKVLQFNAKSADAYFYLGEIQSSLGETAKARAFWRQAYMIDPKHSGAVNRLSS